MLTWIVCGNGCGFRVPPDYYERKRRFAPGQCARCGALLAYQDGQGVAVVATMVLDGPSVGKVVEGVV